jgi:hypothetical protein
VNQGNGVLNLSDGQVAQPLEAAFTKPFTRHIRRRSRCFPDDVQLRSICGKCLKHFGLGKHFIRVPDYTRPSEIPDMVNDFNWA